MFHDKLIESSHEIKQYFAKLPRHQHYRILAKSIAELVSFAEEKPEAIQKMNDVARVLGRRKLNIAPELYTYYSLAVMETLSLLDHRWSPQIEAAWEKTLSRGINHLIDKSVIKF
ncbi:MAG: globin [Planctomycetaceae bacterium]|nr:globin [Planctomycetaceae bacterium]